MSYELNKSGIEAVKTWLADNGLSWNLSATLDEIDEYLNNRSEGEDLEVEMRGPKGLLFFKPSENDVDKIEITE